METLNDVISKRMGNSLVCFMKLVDPERKHSINLELGKAWNALTLVEQRRLYLYLLYKKWRGEPFYGTPRDIIVNCHPYPTDWNGRQFINRLMKENKMVKAYYNGSYGSYTLDEARTWQMTNIEPLNF